MAPLPPPPPLFAAGLDEEVQQVSARDNGTASPSSLSAARNGHAPWTNQTEWVKHESFVHRLERLPSDEDEDEDDGVRVEFADADDDDEDGLDEDDVGEDDGDEDDEDEDDERGASNGEAKAQRRRRKLMKLKERYSARRRSDVPPSTNGEAGLTPSSSGSSSDLQAAVRPAIPRRISSSASPDGADDDFYEAVGSPDGLYTDRLLRFADNEDGDVDGMDDDIDDNARQHSWATHLSSRPPNAATSSATLRQDAIDESDGNANGDSALLPSSALHHQASSATLLGEDTSRAATAGRNTQRRSGALPPSPPPESPLPPTPTRPPAALGPSGTIRGRPRGATLPGSSRAVEEVRTRIRPRSLLSNELSLDFVDASDTPAPAQRVAPRHTPSSSAASFASSSAAAIPSPNGSQSRSGSVASFLMQHTQMRPRSHASFVIAVVGHRGAGKSTVIRKGLRQFGLSRPIVLSDRITSHSTTCIVDQEQRTIEVLEMDASVLLNSGSSRRFAWPRSLPFIDAAILCYDASQISSFRGMSELLENFAMSNLSTVMLACKSEYSPKAVDPYYASDMASVYNVGLAECSVQSEEGKKRMRDCFSYLVKEVAKGRATTLRAAAADAAIPPTLPPPDPDLPSSDNAPTAIAATPAQIQHQQRRREGAAETAAAADAVTQEVLSATVSDAVGRGNSHAAAAATTVAPAAASPTADHTLRRMGHLTVDSNGGSGSVGTGEEDVTLPPSQFRGGGASLQQSIHRAQLGLQSAKSAGGYVSIEELWDKLFFAAVSGNDERFLHMFMTFFRGFARPLELLRQIVARFDALARGEKSDGVMIRYSLMKLTTMLGDWMQEYPGDLSGAETFALLSDFFERLLHHPATMHVAAPMQPLLDVVRHAPDLDAAWSKNQDNDKPSSVAADVPPVSHADDAASRGRGLSVSTSSASSSVPSPITTTTNATTNPPPPAPPPSQSPQNASSTSLASSAVLMEHMVNRERSASDATAASSDGQRSMYAPGTPGGTTAGSSSASISTSGGGGGGGGNGGASLSMQSQKARLRHISNTLFDMRDEDIAHELTRIEWDVFCTVGPRDLLRHILVSRALRAADSPVAQSIAHFNYVSAWVCSLVLIQSKAKQRARMLEKFMEVATILRRTNNYNTLHAILAGLGNTAIHRLKNTRELLNGKRVMKQYQSLTRLMGSERSFAAYRLALENSQGRCIPYLGVHLQDILSTSDGNPSKRAGDGMIHWRKFSLMYDAVMAIVRCQQYQMPLHENAMLTHMILDVPVLDEDALYHRSLQVEQRQSSATTSSAGSRIIKQIFQS